MALSRVDPIFSGFSGDDIFNSFFSIIPALAATGSDLTTSGRDITAQGTRGIPIDIQEDKDKYVVKADIPGVDEERVLVNVDGDVLSIAVEGEQQQEQEQEDQGVRYHRMERRRTFARRAIRMPENADLSKIEANMDNGTLVLEIPKPPGCISPAEAKQETKRIQVGKGQQSGEATTAQQAKK